MTTIESNPDVLLRASKELWDLLDDIETASARFRGNPGGYHNYVRDKAKRRHEFLAMNSEDGSLDLQKV